MSIILKALTQAQSERPPQGVPGLHTVQAQPKPRRAPRRRWLFMIAGLASLNGVMALAALQPWQMEAPGLRAANRSEAPPSAAVQPIRQALIDAAIPEIERRDPAPPAAIRQEKQAAQSAAPGNHIYGIAELPAELQKVANGIVIAGFAQPDNPKERTAIINDRALREGEVVSRGLRVERITEEGVIFSLNGYRFHKGKT